MDKETMIAEKFKETRHKLGMPQREFANLIGCANDKEISYYENNKIVPSKSKQMLVELLRDGDITAERLREVYRRITERDGGIGRR